jgi:hypothetical protein
MGDVRAATDCVCHVTGSPTGVVTIDGTRKGRGYLSRKSCQFALNGTRWYANQRPIESHALNLFLENLKLKWKPRQERTKLAAGENVPGPHSVPAAGAMTQ